jgi:hypothetical protein
VVGIEVVGQLGGIEELTVEKAAHELDAAAFGGCRVPCLALELGADRDKQLIEQRRETAKQALELLGPEPTARRLLEERIADQRVAGDIATHDGSSPTPLRAARRACVKSSSCGGAGGLR